MEAISSRKTIQESAADHPLHPIQVNQWKRQLLNGASELFTCGKKSKDKEEVQVKEGPLQGLLEVIPRGRFSAGSRHPTSLSRPLTS